MIKYLKILNSTERHRITYVFILGLFIAIYESMILLLTLPVIQLKIDPNYQITSGEKFLRLYQILDPNLEKVEYIFIIIILLGTTLTIFFTILINKIVQSVGANLSLRLYNNHAAKSLSEFNSHGVDKYTNELNHELNRYIQNILLPIVMIILKLFLICGMIIFALLTVKWSILLSILPIIMLYVGSNFLSRKSLRSISLKTSYTSEKRLALVTLLGRHFKQLTVNNEKNNLVKEFFQNSYEYGRNVAMMNSLATIPKYIIELLVLVGMLVIVSSETLYTSTSISSADILPLLFMLLKLLPASQVIYSSLTKLRASQAAFENISFDINSSLKNIPSKPTNSPQFSSIEIPEFQKDVENFSLNLLEPVFIERGSKYFIQLPSGTGKTTFVDVLVGLHGTKDFSILVDGIEVNCPLYQYIELEYINQSPFSLNLSVREFLIGSSTTVLDKNIEKILTELKLDDLCKRLNDKLGDNGFAVSGGQLQRLRIAQAILKKPQIIILDESFSGVDELTQASIMSELAKKDITLILITHTSVTASSEWKKLNLKIKLMTEKKC